MRVNSKGYKEWKKTSDRRKFEYRIKKSRENQTKNSNPGKKRIFTEVTKSFIAPPELSLIKNPNDTISYFNKVISFIKTGQRTNYNALLIDAKMVEYLSIDSLMYLLAIINNIKLKRSNIYILRGNLPKNKESKSKFVESGFLKFVTTGMGLSDIETDLNLKIANGTNVDVDVASNLIDFVNSYFETTKVDSKFLYHMIIELMTNTNNHAYSDDYPLMNSWYLYAEKDEDQKKILITFLDTGEGIPRTIAKRVLENIIRKTDTDYIKSAFAGEFRSQTKEKNRGKGLPDIFEHYKNKKIKNFKVISCNGNYVSNDEKKCTDLTETLKGTVFYWELDSNSFEGGNKNDN